MSKLKYIDKRPELNVILGDESESRIKKTYKTKPGTGENRRPRKY